MIDREKVIKGLECCIKCPNEYGDCMGGECPYGPRIECHKELLHDALALLKAQEAVEPVPAIDDDGDWICGNCYQSVIWTEELDASGFVPVKFNFCPNCGKAVKWE